MNNRILLDNSGFSGLYFCTGQVTNLSLPTGESIKMLAIYPVLSYNKTLVSIRIAIKPTIFNRENVQIYKR